MFLLLLLLRAAFARFPASGPDYVIDIVTNNYSQYIGRKIQGHFMVPWYLNDVGVAGSVTSRLVLDSAGVPQYQSMQAVNFTVMVPWSVMGSGDTPGRIVQYGHGYVL